MVRLKKIKFKYVISADLVIRVLLVFFLCTCTGHKSGRGFDAIICRLSFIMLAAAEVFKLIKSKKLHLRTTFFWYLSFVGVYYASVLWAESVDAVLFIGILYNFIQILGVTLIIEDNFSTREDFIDLFKYILIAVMYMVFRLVLKTPISEWGSERVGGALALNANTVGIWTSTAVMITLFLSVSNKKYYILSIILLFVAMMSGSRKAFIISAGEIFLFFFCKDKGWRFARNILIGTCALLLLIYAVFKIPLFYNVIGFRIERAVRTFLGLKVYSKTGLIMREHSSWERAFFRQQGYHMFFERPLLGWGGNNFATYLGLIGYSNQTYSHCNYVELLSTLGIVGAISFYGYPFFNLIKGMKAYISNMDLLTLNCIIILTTNLIVQYFMVSYYGVINMFILICCLEYIRMSGKTYRK